MRPGPRRRCAIRKPAPLAHDLVAGRVGRHDDHAERAVCRRIELGAAHHRRVGRDVGSRGEPLAAVDHPLPVLEDGGRLELRGVGACDVGLGHPEAREHLARDERLQVAVAPLVRGELVQHDRVLERVRAQRHHRRRGASDHLVHVDVVQEGQPLASDLLRVAERPEPLLLRGLHQVAHHPPALLGAALLQRLLDGIDLLFDEALDRVANRSDAIGYLEAHAGLLAQGRDQATPTRSIRASR
jgi:hypothetical protein